MTILGKREPVKHGGPFHVRLAPAALQGDAGTSGLGFCNLFRRLKAAGSLSFFPLVPACKQASGGIFHRLFFAPAFLSVPVFHATNKAWSSQHDAQRNRASRTSGA